MKDFYLTNFSEYHSCFPGELYPHIYKRKSSQSIYAFLVAYIYKSKNPIILKITEFLSSFLLLKNCLSKMPGALIPCGFRRVLSELCTQRAPSAETYPPAVPPPPHTPAPTDTSNPLPGLRGCRRHTPPFPVPSWQ